MRANERVLVKIDDLEKVLADPSTATDQIERLKSAIEDSQDKVQFVWAIEDVHETANNYFEDDYECDDEGNILTDDEARNVLSTMENCHDCNYGMNWEVIQVYVGDILNERGE